MQVMFVDDERRVLAGIERTLAMQDKAWACRFVTSGAQALAMLEEQPADVVVSDMRMPFMNGAELLTQVRNRWPGTIRIILTGYSDLDASLHMLDVAHQFVSKPTDNTQLLAAVEKALALRHLFLDSRAAEILGRTSRLPAAPRVFADICHLLADPNSNARRIRELLGSDPALSAKLLQLANSAYFAGNSRIHDVGDAIARLGLDQVGLLVLASQVFADNAHDPYIDHLQQRAFLASRLATHIAGRRGPAATAALLAHVGLIVPEMREAEAAAASDTAETPMHAAVGAYLLALWGLPTGIVDAVMRHHDPASAAEPGFGLVGTVHTAVALASGEAPNTAYLEQTGAAERLPEWQAAHQHYERNAHE
jgi:HD-like signal output (HDOD) protein